MKQLYATFEESEVEFKGKKTPVKEYFFRIKDEPNYSAEEISFKVLATRNRLLSWSIEGTTVTKESVFFEGVFKNENIPDSSGGNACGRSFATWEGVKSFDDARRAEENKKARWYTYLFGEVTFPGKAPVVVNYRLTGPQSMSWGAIEKALGKDVGGALLKVVPVGGAKNDKFVLPEYTILQTGLDTSETKESLAAIEAYIDGENDKILELHYAAKKALENTSKAEDAPF